MLLIMGRLADGEQTDVAAAAATRTGSATSAASAGTASPLRDEVDDLTEAWRRQRPDLDVEPLHVLSRVSRLARHLDIARRSAFAAHTLESWEFDVLSALRRAGPPFQLTPGALLRATLVTSGTMTNRIDRLAALSDRGRDVVDAAFTDLLDREQALLASLPGDERAVLAELLRTLLAPFDAADQ
jgi:hypothetical protein